MPADPVPENSVTANNERQAEAWAEFRRVMTFLESEGVRLVRGYGRDENSVPFGGHSIRRLHETYAEGRP